MIVLAQQNKWSAINFTKLSAKFCLSLHYNDKKSYLYVNKTNICECKGLVDIKSY